MSIVPAARAWAPNSASSMLPWPCPTRPPRPRISPFLISTLTLAQRRASQAGRREQHLVVGMKLIGEGRFGGFLPGHQPDRLVLRDGSVSAIDTSAPFLSMATRLQKRTISSQRCEMKRMMAPDLRRPAMSSASHADLVVAERRGRFVEQEHPRIALDGAHDLQHLLLAKRKIADTCSGIDVEAMASKNLLRRLAGALVERCCPRRGSARRSAGDCARRSVRAPGSVPGRRSRRRG